MAHKKIRIPIETSVEVMEELGKLDDCIQFVDLNVHNYEERKILVVILNVVMKL